MNYAIIGCGLIGKKRVTGMPVGAKLIVACDTNLTRAEELVKLAKSGRACADFNDAVSDPQVQVVFIATLNSTLQPIALAAVKHGKHVLVEKPAAISTKELDELEAAAKKTGVKLMLSVVTAPAWAREPGVNVERHGPPANPADYANFLTAILQRYPGQVHAIEVWNEMNLDREWTSTKA